MLNVIPIATIKTAVQRYTLTDMLEISKWNSKKYSRNLQEGKKKKKKKQNKQRKQTENKIKW